MATPIYQELQKQLFTWREWDYKVPNTYINCITKVQMGKYPTGSKIYLIYFDSEISAMSLFETVEDYYTHKTYEVRLHLSVST